MSDDNLPSASAHTQTHTDKTEAVHVEDTLYRDNMMLYQWITHMQPHNNRLGIVTLLHCKFISKRTDPGSRIQTTLFILEGEAVEFHISSDHSLSSQQVRGQHVDKRRAIQCN